MSIKVMNWVWDHSPAKGTELLMLLAIADNAADDGANAYPSVSTLARKTRLDERTVRRIVRRLCARGDLIVEERGGRQANRYTVLMQAQLSTPRASCPPGKLPPPGEVPGHPWHQRQGTPGAAMPPEPPRTVLEPSSRTRASEDVGTAVGEGESSEDIQAVLDGLGSAWQLTPKQRQRLAPKVVEALQAGWSTGRLVAHLGANPAGVRSPAAVLSARLDDLPVATTEPEKPSARADWCGRCDEPSRRIERDDGRLAPCPDCHPHKNRNSGRSKPPSTRRPESSTPTDHENGRSTTSVPDSA